jgi:peptidoglycan/xylan/chitin deacetylase (PgdA/CDA1 family)
MLVANRLRTVLVAAAATVLALAVTAPAGAASSRHAVKHTHNSCRNGYVGLTFDDGPSATLPQLLQALQASRLRATMFNQGNNALARPDYVRDELRAGMWVGNHTFTHPHLPQLGEPQAFEEIASTQWVLTDITHRIPTLFRPPYGETSDQVRADEQRLRLLEVLWTVDSRDWAGASADEIVAAVATLQPGGIILMHDWPPATIQAIPGIARVLADKQLCPGRIAYTAQDIPYGDTTFHAVAVKPTGGTRGRRG